jgi:AmmeMemoRadiSam system protein B/AmmeMemoRadiSam system protein A
VLVLSLGAGSFLSAGSCLASSSTLPGPAIRPPAVAGDFYPADSVRLRAAARALLAEALPARGERPIALVVPHAGYAYSGPVAADGWRQVQGRDYDLVVVLGTNHTTAGFGGVSVWARGGFRTPLGVVPVDSGAAARLMAADPDCAFDPAVHAREHSIEVQLPFLQTVLPGARILPLVVGREDPALCERLGRALARVLADRRVLLVASSDLSHYPEYDGARASDRAVLAAMAGLDPGALRAAIAAQMSAGHPGLVTCACGEAPVMALLAAARALGATRGTVLSWANSGDTSVGDRARVVGYGAVMFTAGPPGTDTRALAPPGPRAAGELGPTEKRLLLAFARRTLEQFLTTETVPLAREFPSAAERAQGAFVTLREHDDLRGCIGYMAEDQPLDQVVGRMTLAAAFQDPRFRAVTADELERIEIEISALTPLQPVAGPDAVVLGRDGVEIRMNGRSGVFLPEVALEQRWNLAELMENLCLKAGLPTDAWKRGARLYTFRSIHFRESDFR